MIVGTISRNLYLDGFKEKSITFDVVSRSFLEFKYFLLTSLRFARKSFLVT